MGCELARIHSLKPPNKPTQKEKGMVDNTKEAMLSE